MIFNIYFRNSTIPLQMEIAEIEKKVTALIYDKLGVEEKQIISTASFKNDLGADSLDTVELIMEFEQGFDIKIKDEDADKVVTVGDAIQMINKIKNP